MTLSGEKQSDWFYMSMWDWWRRCGTGISASTKLGTIWTVLHYSHNKVSNSAVTYSSSSSFHDCYRLYFLDVRKILTSFLLVPKLFSLTMFSAAMCWYLEHGGKGRFAIAITPDRTSTTLPPEYRQTSAWHRTSCSCSDSDDILHTHT